jgi:hypothetical protein
MFISLLWRGGGSISLVASSWVKPEGRWEFVDWTPDQQLRHMRFIGPREGKRAADVTRE